MPKFENTMGINAIKFEQRTRNFCPLGDDYYTNQFVVTFEPGSFIPDYLDITDSLNNRLEGKNLTVEDAVAEMYDIIAEYEPIKLEVQSYADDAVHFPVNVIKSSS